MKSNFFAHIARMRLIRRWSLMYNTSPENIQEHSFRTAVLAHALAVIGCKKFGRTVDPEHAAFLALFHDAAEVMTGDLPTPIKYFDAGIRQAYKSIEAFANRKLLEFLPPEFRDAWAPAFMPVEKDEECHELVRAADKLCAWLKCIEEKRSGNREFLLAQEALKKQLDAMDLPEVKYFMEHFAEGFSLTLDELGGPDGGGSLPQGK